jgi:ribose 5-phosphate isomerase RpiB
MRRMGIAADHGGFTLNGQVAKSLRGSGHGVDDYQSTRARQASFGLRIDEGVVHENR